MRKSTEILLTPFGIFFFLWAVVHIVWTDVVRPRFRRFSEWGVLVLATFLWAQAADGALTYMGLRAGVAQEANPLVDMLMGVLGPVGGLIAAKSFASVGGVFLFWVHSPRALRALAALTVFYIAAAVLPWMYLLLTQ